MTVFDTISFELDKKGMTRAELSRKSGIGESTLRAWEKTEPKAAMLKKVADALGVPMEYLLTGEREDAPAPKVKDVFPWLDAEGAEEISEIADGWNSLDARGRRNVMDTFRREKTEAEDDEKKRRSVWA